MQEAWDRAMVTQLEVKYLWQHATQSKSSASTLGPSLSDDKLRGAINAACEGLPSMPFWKQDVASASQPKVGASRLPFDAKEA